MANSRVRADVGMHLTKLGLKACLVGRNQNLLITVSGEIRTFAVEDATVDL